MNRETDTAIIGAGPVGLELSVALQTRGVDHVVLDAGEIGSTMAWWAPGTKYFSSPERIAIAGVPLVVPDQEKATREQYLDYLRGIAQQFALPVRTFKRVERARAMGDGFRLRVTRSWHGVGGPQEAEREARRTLEHVAPPADDGGATIDCRRVVLAIGNMHSPRLLAIPGEDLPHVSHFLGDPNRYFGRRVLIVGGKNSAAEAAIRLYRAGAEVTVSYRKDAFDAKRIKYWLLPELGWLIDKGRIAFMPNSTPIEILPDRVRLGPTDGDGSPVEHAQPRDIACDDVLLLTGYIQDKTLFEQLGVELVGDERKPRFDRTTMQTNIPGVYVAGTAIGGSQIRTRIFIENAHIHVDRIVAAITGEAPPDESDIPEVSFPES